MNLDDKPVPANNDHLEKHRPANWAANRRMPAKYSTSTSGLSASCHMTSASCIRVGGFHLDCDKPGELTRARRDLASGVAQEHESSTCRYFMFALLLCVAPFLFLFYFIFLFLKFSKNPRTYPCILPRMRKYHYFSREITIGKKQNPGKSRNLSVENKKKISKTMKAKH